MPPLRDILDAATPGPWEYDGYEHVVSVEIADIVCGTWQGHDKSEADARLIALAPELAQLALDMGEELKKHGSEYRDEHGSYISERRADALLARLDQLGKEPSDG